MGVIAAFIVRSDEAVAWVRANARWLYAALGALVRREGINAEVDLLLRRNSWVQRLGRDVFF